MTTSRDAFLHRVRQAIEAGNRPGRAAELGPRGNVGYQGAGPDPVARLRDEMSAAGGQVHIVADQETAIAQVLQLVTEKSARRVLLGRGPFLDALSLAGRLGAAGVEVLAVDAAAPDGSWSAFFSADIGISGVDYLVAETGSVALLAGPGEPRSLSLLPPVHIAVGRRGQIVPDLFDLFDSVAAAQPGAKFPSCVSLITGPSKTGDIELRLVTGVHGPGEIHLVLVND